MGKPDKDFMFRDLIELSQSDDPVFIFTWVQKNVEILSSEADNGDKQAGLIVASYKVYRLFPEDSVWDILIDAIDNYLNIAFEKASK